MDGRGHFGYQAGADGKNRGGGKDSRQQSQVKRAE